MTQPSPCGTAAGAGEHYRRGQKPCQPCRRALTRQRWERKLGYWSQTLQNRLDAGQTLDGRARRKTIADCGTRGGYGRHLRRGERPCEPCRAANNTDARQRRQPAAKKELVHGTRSGYIRHLRRGERPCEPCRAANNTYQRERTAQKLGSRRRRRRSLKHTLAERLGAYRCDYCWTPKDPDGLEIEHMTPLSRGGTWALWNLTLSCRACNMAKFARTIGEWLPNG